MSIKLLMALGVVTVLASACGAGGGADAEADYAYLATMPSEALLCSFVVGQTTQGEILDALGEPTFTTASAGGDSLQYWVGRDSFSGATPPRIISFGFDAGGHLDLPYVQQLPFPSCWRNPASELDDQE